MYVLVNANGGCTVNSYPLSLKGWTDAVTFASILAQAIELYPDGIRVCRREDDGTLHGILNIKKVTN